MLSDVEIRLIEQFSWYILLIDLVNEDISSEKIASNDASLQLLLKKGVDASLFLRTSREHLKSKLCFLLLGEFQGERKVSRSKIKLTRKQAERYVIVM